MESPRRGVHQRGARPDAGVLWFEASDWRSNADKESELRWTVGFTGRQALAAPIQRFFHNVAPGWNRPIDWTKQLPAEPVFAMSYDQRLLRTAGAVELQPHVGASLGKLLTDRPLVTDLQLGTTVRWRELGLSWTAHQTGAEYVARHGPHAWSTLEAKWWPGR